MSNSPDKEALLILLRNYPDAAAAFAFSPPKLNEIFGEADVVVDTNALLLPYRADISSLDETIRVYGDLSTQNRFHVPQHVAREFVKHRPEHIASLQQHIFDKTSKVTAPDDITHPVLESSSATNELNKALEAAKSAKKSVQAEAKKVRDEIVSWEWGDPVSAAYRSTIATRIMSFPIIEEDLCADYVRRSAYKIPPGYKDAGKETNAIGDLFIWHEILELGKAKSSHVVFVSGEEKPDWVYRVGENTLLPRYELVDEFRRASNGKCFYMIPLSRLLELANADTAVVSQIKAEEDRASNATSIVAECPECLYKVEIFLAEPPGSSALPNCPSCSMRFHVHRLRDSVTVHRHGERESIRNASLSVEAPCPSCSNLVPAQLEAKSGATTWCRCARCQARFAAHRNQSLEVICGAAVG